MHFWVKVDCFARFLGESGLFWPQLWTILDTLGPWGGDAFTPLAPPLAMGLLIYLSEMASFTEDTLSNNKFTLGKIMMK